MNADANKATGFAITLVVNIIRSRGTMPVCTSRVIIYIIRIYSLSSSISYVSYHWLFLHYRYHPIKYHTIFY